MSDNSFHVGSVLDKDHPFAKDYEAERRRQIERIRRALKEATGDAHPEVWESWISTIGE